MRGLKSTIGLLVVLGVLLPFAFTETSGFLNATIISLAVAGNLRILELGDEILGRSGEIVEAARAHYRRALEREPWLAEAMIGGGRGREVAAAGSF